MAWKGESRRHSLARKGIKTASGLYEEERRKQYEERKKKEIEEKREYLKRYHPDWFIDLLEYYTMTHFKINKDQFIKLSRKNRKNRLNEAIGELVIFRVWVGHLGELVTYAKLIEIDGDEVILEIDGKEVRTKAFNIHYAKRKEKKKETKKREKKIPSNKLGFKLIRDTWKHEDYQAELEYHGSPVKINVQMRYGTRVKSWYVDYTISYMQDGKWGYFTWLGEEGKSGIKSRKDARRYAFELIEKASTKDIDELKEFYRKRIINGKR